MIRAFTLIELIIGLIISSIVVIMAGAVFNITARQFGEYKRTNEKLKDWSTLKFLLETDVDRSDCLKFTDENKLEVFYQNRSIEYDWIGDGVLRISGNVTDTFKVQIDKLDLSFLNAVQLERGGLVDQVGFQLKYDDETYSCCFRKKYSSHVLMAQETERKIP